MTPQALLKLAQAEKEPEPSSKSVCWPYLESAHILRQKRWMWKDISSWMTEHAGITLKDIKAWQRHHHRWVAVNNIPPIKREKLK
jgi:predicted RNA-binding protein with PUA-like domain